MTPNFESNLTIQQQAFVAEYVIDFDATRAAISAGYSQKSAMSQGCQLLKNPKVQNAISEALEEYGTKQQILKKRVVNELTNLAFSDTTEFYQNAAGEFLSLADLKALPKKKRAAIREIRITNITREDSTTQKIELSLWSKEKALELLGKHLGMLKEQVEVTDSRKADSSDKKMTFEEFCECAGYPQPFPKQVEMFEFGIKGEGARILLGARGYGKSDYVVVLGIAYQLYMQVTFTALIVTKSRERNAAMLKEISAACQKAGMTFEIDNSTSLRVSGHIGKDHSVSAATINSVTLRGRHPMLIVMDDPVTPDDTSEATRRKAKQVYNEINKLNGNVLLIGQPVHKFDLYEELRGKINTMEVPHGSIPELDADLEAQRLAGVDEASIQASYHLKILSEGEIPFDKIRYIDKFPLGPGNSTVAFIDPSFEGGDYTAVTILRTYMQGVAVVGFAYKRAWNNCLEDLAKQFQRFSVGMVCFETNCLGNQPLEILRRAFGNSIGVRGRKSNTNKHSRIMAAGSFAHMIHLSKESDKIYTDQVVRYEHNAKNDDAPDSLASCLEWVGLIRGKL